MTAIAIIVFATIGYSRTQLGGPVTFVSTSSLTESTQTRPTSTSTSQSAPQSTLQLTAQSTCTAGVTATVTITVSVGQSSPPCGCMLVDSNSSGSLYVSPNPKVGDNVCLQATLNHSMQVFLKITNTAGSVVFSTQCAATGGAGPSSRDTCLSLWDTTRPDPQGNPIEAGRYHIVAGGDSAVVSLEANLMLA